jgi:hypothetical protein
MTNKVTRREVYDAIDTERSYQLHVVEEDSERYDDSLPDHSVGDYLVMLDTYLLQAKVAWTKNAGDAKALHDIRKIAGIAVHCMEDHGAPKRVFN